MVRWPTHGQYALVKELMLVSYRTLAIHFAHFELRVCLAVARAPVRASGSTCDHVGDGLSRPAALPRDAAIGTCNCKAAINELTRAR